MKIRIRGNSVRYRLTKSEVQALATHGSYTEAAVFPKQTLTYSVKESDVPQLQATFEETQITLHLPKGEKEKWANSNQVGHYAEQKLADGTLLTLTLEKDFVCLDETVEDQSDNYPNPKA